MDDRAAEIIVPVFGMIFVFGFPITAWVVFRWLAHRERMEMIRAGIAPPPGRGNREWRQAYQAQQQPGRPPSGNDEYTLESGRRQLRKGITLTFVGLALFIGLSFIGFGDGGWRPGPWLLGGLIPMFVGIAQVVSAILFGATLGPVRAFGTPGMPGMPHMPPPAGAGPSPGVGAAPTFDGSYTYRPGGTQELQPPYSPPERRP